MGFPVPSEAFAQVELRGLRNAGCRVSASTLRTPGRGHRALLREHGLQDMSVSYARPLKLFAGLAVLGRHPGAAWHVCREVFPALAGRWREMLICAALLPRAFGIASEVRRSGVDHVHLFWGHFPCLVGLAIRELGASATLSMSLGAYDLVKRSPLSRLLARRLPVLTHAWVNVSAISDLAGIPPDRVTVVYRGIEVGEAPRSGQRSEVPCVLVAERLVPEKRTVDALEVFARVSERVPEAVLMVLGDGPSRKALEDWVYQSGLGDRVHFSGFVPHHEVREAMAQAHVLLSMTQSPGERLPNVVKEAMASECAVVVRRSPGIEELVREGIDGYIVEPAAVEEAAGRLAELLADPRRAERLGRNGRQHVRERFDVASTTRQRLECWFPDREKTCPTN